MHVYMYYVFSVYISIILFTAKNFELIKNLVAQS